MGRKTPTQVRVRTDPNDGYGYRYDAIQHAKAVFDVGNNTDAIIAACEHAREDQLAKQEAVAFLAKRADPEIVAGVVERLGMSTMPIRVEVEYVERDGTVQPKVGVDLE